MVRRRKQPELLVLTLARLLFLHWTGWYAGYAWVEDELLREIAREVDRFLQLIEGPRPETQEPVVAILPSVWKAKRRLAWLAPPGRPNSELRFFGCDDWGKIMPASEIRRSA